MKATFTRVLSFDSWVCDQAPNLVILKRAAVPENSTYRGHGDSFRLCHDGIQISQSRTFRGAAQSCRSILREMVLAGEIAQDQK